MERTFYVRLGVFLTAIVVAWFSVWPSVNQWVPAPSWVRHRFPNKISPGLDIRGGLRLVYEVEVDEAIRDLRDGHADHLVDAMCKKLHLGGSENEPCTREQRERTVREHMRVTKVGDTQIVLTFHQASEVNQFRHVMRDTANGFGDLREVGAEGNTVTVEMIGDRLSKLRDESVEQARQTVSNRVDGLGLRETSVTKRDDDIIIEIPGADQSVFDHIRGIISQTARLEFKLVDDDSTYVGTLHEDDLPDGVTRGSEQTSAGTSRPNVVVQYLQARGVGSREKLDAYVHTLMARPDFPEDHILALGKGERADAARNRQQGRPVRPEDEVWRTYMVFARAEVTGNMIDDAYVGNDPETGKPVVQLSFKPDGADVFGRLTGQNVKRRFAIVLDDKVESAPVINGRIPNGRCQITMGGYDDYNTVLNEANDLVLVLKAGALPAPIRPANEQLIGPTLGGDAVTQGATGAFIGIILVLLFMAVYYEVGGLIADLMVTFNLLFIFAVLSFFEATLTLPGIAGLALTVGMAVDANVLINERIREELRAGKSARAAVDQGFGRAFLAIFDGHVTTFISGVVLYQYGTGPIRGFAVTLIIGIVASLFTGVFCSRIAFDWLVRGLRVERLRVG